MAGQIVVFIMSNHIFVMISSILLQFFDDCIEMDNVEVTAASGKSGKSGVIVWTSSMTNNMLGFLADLVAKGKRTSSVFRETLLKQCAAVFNEQFKLTITSDKVRNHLKKWRKIWVRVVNLKNLSGALWDEDTCTIRLSEEYYAGHCMVSFL